MAKLYFRYGAMNCGKSTAMLQAAYNYEERGMKVLILKPEIDTKGDDQVVSRLGTSRKVDFMIAFNESTTDKLSNERLANIACILVDEAQFLQPFQIDELFWLAVNSTIPVICYGLRADFKMVGFPGATRLLQIAHSIEELKTICRCGKKAMLNGRKRNGAFIFDGNQVAIEGEDQIEYESLCPLCYQTEKLKTIQAVDR